MEKIRELTSKLLEECKEKKVPMMCCYLDDKVKLAEYGTTDDKTPDRIKRARTAFINAPSQTKGVMEFD